MSKKIKLDDELIENESITEAEDEAVAAEATEEVKEEPKTEAEGPKVGEDFLYERQADKKRTDEYDIAVKTIVFGSLSIVLPMFALILYTLGGYLMAILAAGLGLAFAVIAFKASKSITTLGGSLTAAMSKNGRLLSIIGIAVSAAVLAYVFIGVILSILMIIGLIIFYVIYIIAIIIIAIVSQGM